MKKRSLTSTQTKDFLEEISEGEALKKFLHNNKINLTNFCERIKKSRGWLYDLFKQETIPLEYKALITYNLNIISFDDILNNKEISHVYSNNENEFELLKRKNDELEERIKYYLDMIRDLHNSFNKQAELIIQLNHK